MLYMLWCIPLYLMGHMVMASKSLIVTASGWKQFFVPADVKMTFLELREFNVIVLVFRPQKIIL